jgi:hypothetical protein
MMQKREEGMIHGVALRANNTWRIPMNATTLGYRMALASLAFAGLCCGTAGAAGVSEKALEDMNHWYGRAGGPTASDAITDANASQAGKSVEVGVPANSGSLYYNEAGGGIRSEPNIRSSAGPVQVGVPANSGSLYYDEAGGGIRSKPHMRSETGQPTASLKQEPGSSNQH